LMFITIDISFSILEVTDILTLNPGEIYLSKEYFPTSVALGQ